MYVSMNYRVCLYEKSDFKVSKKISDVYKDQPPCNVK